MKKYIIKVKNEEVYLKYVMKGRHKFLMPIVTKDKEEAGFLKKAEAKTYVQKLNKFREEYDWEWEMIELI